LEDGGERRGDIGDILSHMIEFKDEIR